MKASRKNIISFTVVLFLVSSIATTVQAYKLMPPTFTFEQDAEEILRNYPLGLINMREAFAHHGAPVRKLILPNENRGWLYSTGEELGVPNIYILQFSDKDVVIDVFHKSLHDKNGHSALQYQFLQGVTPELKITGPGPGG